MPRMPRLTHPKSRVARHVAERRGRIFAIAEDQRHIALWIEADDMTMPASTRGKWRIIDSVQPMDPGSPYELWRNCADVRRDGELIYPDRSWHSPHFTIFTPNVRLWIPGVEGDPCLVTLRPGSPLTITNAGLTDEGGYLSQTAYALMPENTVERDDFRRETDCDGRHETLLSLIWRGETSDHPNDVAAWAVWEERGNQVVRDHFAEAAGY